MDESGTTETNRAAGGGLAEIGAMLRRRREEIGQDLVAIASTTHIRLNYLKAIEDGRQRDLPGTAYMIGYIRTYADHLGFDGNRLISDFHAELAGQRKLEEKRAEAAEPPSTGLPQIQISPATLMAVVLVLGVAVYAAWGYFSSDEQAVQTVAESPAQDGLATAAAPAAKPESPSPTGAEASAPPPQVQPAPVIPPAPVAAATPEPAAEDQMPPEAELASAAEEAADDPAAEEPAPADADAKAGKIVVRARLESWIQVTDAKKDVLFSRVLRAGETYTVPDEKGLLLTTGNAGGIEILVNGKKLKSFGTVGLVKRDIALDPKKLKDGSAFKTTSRD